MSSFQVSASDLREASNKFREANARFKTQVGNLAEQEGSLASMWEGEAKNAFHTAFMNDKGQMDNFYALIEQYCNQLDEMARMYEQAEAANTQTASSRSYK